MPAASSPHIARSSTPAFTVVDNFMAPDIVHGMRRALEVHFSAPSSHRPDTHQIWNYWYVPGQYTYLRTRPEAVLPRDQVESFIGALRTWSLATLGLGHVTWPYLSMYVNGCNQGLHNDSRNGRFGFVFSLTRPDRRTTGGRTIILREGDPFRQNLRKANAGSGLHELIEPEFNRLLVFDDRLVHGVDFVSGSMDPLDARFVLHGHITEAGPVVVGHLPIDALRDSICATVDGFVTAHAASIQSYHGPLVVKFDIASTGNVSNVAVLVDRVIHEHDEGDVEWGTLRGHLLVAIAGTVFPKGRANTTVTLPITLGGPISREA